MPVDAAQVAAGDWEFTEVNDRLYALGVTGKSPVLAAVGPHMRMKLAAKIGRIGVRSAQDIDFALSKILYPPDPFAKLDFVGVLVRLARKTVIDLDPVMAGTGPKDWEAIAFGLMNRGITSPQGIDKNLPLIVQTLKRKHA